MTAMARSGLLRRAQHGMTCSITDPSIADSPNSISSLHLDATTEDDSSKAGF
jgi:hypothetical protein